MKKFLTLTLAIVLILAFTGIAQAAAINITSASSGISRSGTTVYMSSTTYCSPSATSIRHTIVLQRYSGGWQTYSTATRSSSGTGYTSYVSKSVSPGYQYRVVTYHTVYNGPDTDTAVTTSSSVFVG